MRYISASCLFIDKKGKLFRIRCPFKVRVRNANRTKENVEYIVERIFQIDETIILFEINKVEVNHSDYDLILQ